MTATITTLRMNAIRKRGGVEIDAEANLDADGRWNVGVIVINNGRIEGTWYADVLDSLTQGDLDALADEAMAAHA
jgi:hypothetical protein